MPITLTEAAEIFPLAYSTLVQAAREGRLEARAFKRNKYMTWLTTPGAVEAAIEAGKLRPRMGERPGE